MIAIPPEVAQRLGYYVYLYIDPRTDRPFYVGEGQGGRVLDHLSESGESRKLRTIEELRREGREPRLDILAHGLRDEETAFRIEAAVIDLFGLEELTNEVRGWRSLQLGRIPLRELIVYYAAQPVEVTVPALLIRINQLYRHNMPPQELYEATRGIWKIGARREATRYGIAVFEGVVRAVYTIDAWYPAGSTAYETRDATQLIDAKRWEFVGQPAPEPIWSQYVDRSAERRTVTGKKVSQLRRAGVIPAVVYGHSLDATSIQVDERALNQTLMRAGMNRLVNIQLGSEALVTLVRAIQREPISQKVTHVDFQAVAMDEPITTSVSILLEGEAPALKLGGTLLQALDALEIRALPANLISSVTADVSGLVDFDAAVHVRDIQVPATVEVLTGPDELVAKVTPPAVEEEEEAGTEGEEAAQPEVISETEAQRRRSEREE